MSEKRTKGLLGFIERVGNKLPHPGTLFLIMTIIVIGISAMGQLFGWSATYQGLVKVDGVYTTAEVSVTAKSLLTIEGITYMFSSLVSNFTSFAPLGTVLVALVGIGVAEYSGLIGAALRLLALKTPKRLLTMTIVFLGIMSSIATDAGYVVLPPLAAMIFLSLGRHPLAGIAAAFAGVSGGFSANLLPGALDSLLAGLTEEAAHIINPAYEVAILGNYYFMIVSTVLITIVGTFVTEKIIEPRLGTYKGNVSIEQETVSKGEQKALFAALISGFATVLLLVGIYFLIGQSLFLGDGIVPIIVIAFIIPGITYGKSIGTIKGNQDVMEMITKSFSTMSSYLVLVFFAAQFIAFFNYSNLGTLLAVNGSTLLQRLNAPHIILILAFILIVAFINLFMGSSSAKWAILAPVFVPMLMELGISPEFSQLAYRIGDSTTNIISPLMSYFAMIIVYVQKYDKKASFGTLISLMLPYSCIFMVAWSLLLIAWMLLGLPIGVDTVMNYIPL